MAVIGRADELSQLRTAWSSLVRGAEAVRPAVITGAARHRQEPAGVRGPRRLHADPGTYPARHRPGSPPAPYDRLASVLSGHEFADPPVPPDALAWLAQHPDAARERYTPDGLLRVAVRVARALVDAGPAVIVVEDLHALDPASLTLVGELATAPRLRALLLVTCRLPEADGTLAGRTLGRLCGAGALRQHLAPLGTADVRALLAVAYPSRVVPMSTVDAAMERTGGNRTG